MSRGRAGTGGIYLPGVTVPEMARRALLGRVQDFRQGGRVANIAHDKIHSTCDAGIEFVEISDKDKEKLERYIMDEAEKI